MAEFGYPPDMKNCSAYGPSRFAIDSGVASPEYLDRDPLAEMQLKISGLKIRLCPGWIPWNVRTFATCTSSFMRI